MIMIEDGDDDYNDDVSHLTIYLSLHIAHTSTTPWAETTISTS